MSAVMPLTVPVEQTKHFQDEWAIRYGILMGGAKKVDLPGIGQFWVGHTELPRRELRGFTRQRVGVRNETDSAISEVAGTSLPEEHTYMEKSPRACATEVSETYRPQGFVVPLSLIGEEPPRAERLLSLIMPADIASQPLVDVIAYIESQVEDSTFIEASLHAKVAQLKEELLQAAYVCRNYLQNYTNSISEEVHAFKDKGKGKHALDALDREYYWELKKPLPEELPTLGVKALGQEIAAAVSQKGGDNDLKGLISELAEQNRLLAESMKTAEVKSAETPTKDSGNPGTQATSIRRRADGQPDRRFKVK